MIQPYNIPNYRLYTPRPNDEEKISEIATAKAKSDVPAPEMHLTDPRHPWIAAKRG